MWRSGRASKLNKKYDTIAPPSVCPEHRSGTPIDATRWCPRYLRQQGIQYKPGFRHLDFVRMDVENIKKILWSDAVEKKFGNRCSR